MRVGVANPRKCISRMPRLFRELKSVGKKSERSGGGDDAERMDWGGEKA